MWNNFELCPSKDICKKLLKHNLKLTSEGILWNNPLELKRRSLHWSSLMLSEWVGPNWLRLKGRQGCAQRTEVYCIYWCDKKIIVFIDLTKKLRRMKRQIWQLQKKEQSAKIKMPSEMEVAPRYNCWHCWQCWHCWHCWHCSTLLTWRIMSNHFIHICLVPIFQ